MAVAEPVCQETLKFLVLAPFAEVILSKQYLQAEHLSKLTEKSPCHRTRDAAWIPC
jgi:hypothetical protein